MTAALERRLGAVEKRLGTSGNPLEQLSDADLDAMLEWVHAHLAEQGNAKSIAALAAGDAREVEVRKQYEAAGHFTVPRVPAVRWPYQRAKALSQGEHPSYTGPRSARTDAELRHKLEAVMATIGARP